MPDLFDQWFNIPQSTLRGLSELGITVHWIILQYSIGLLTLAVLMEIVAYKREDEQFIKISRTLSKVAIVIFAVGSATGSLSEFGLLLFWPNFLELVGKYYFIPMYLEVFAFFAEVIFVYMYFYTWERVSRKFHVTIGILAVIGIFAAAILIMSVNNLMGYPPGILETYDATLGVWVEPEYLLYLPEGGTQIFTSSELRGLIDTDLNRYHAILGATVTEIGVFGIVFQSPGAIVNGLHAYFGAITVTIFTILGVYAWRLMKAKEKLKQLYYEKGIKIMAFFGGVVLMIQGIIGIFVAENMAKYNPEKLSALEGNSNTITTIMDIPFVESIINFLAYGDTDAQILDYENIPESFQVPLIIHYFYYIKLFLVSILFLDVLVFGYLTYKKKPFSSILLKLNIAAPIIVQLVSNFGWIVREAGRKPWTIYGVQTVDEAARADAMPFWVVLGVIIYSLGLILGLGLLVWYLFREKDEEEEKITEDLDEEVAIIVEES